MKFKTFLFLFPLFLTLFLASSERVLGCTCVPSAPCQNYDRADVVFVGKVLSSKFQRTVDDYEYSVEADGTYVQGKTTKITYDVGEIYFQVEEGFRGAEKGAKITIYSGTGGGDCGFWFKRGESYVVFASKEKSNTDSGISSMTGGSSQNLKPNAERLWTTICSGTRESKSAENALVFLRDLPKSGSGGTIVGRIDESINDYSNENLTGKPMVGAKVKAEQTEGEKRVFFGVTDKNGYFEIKVPPGTYLVVPVLEPNLTFDGRYEGENAPLKIADTKCDAKIFWVTNDSEISGKALDAAGKPYSYIALDLVPADKERKDKDFDYKFATVAEDGTFSFKGVPPGRYLLSLNYTDTPEDDSPFPTTFYPQTGVRKQAQIFDIGLGTKIKDVLFRLPPQLTKRKITGTVVWKNGKPAVGAEVQLEDVEFDKPTDIIFNPPKTNAKGEFTMEWFDGRQYRIKVIVWKKNTDGSGFAIADAETEVFTLDAKTQKFRIVLNAINPNEKSITTTTVRAN